MSHLNAYLIMNESDMNLSDRANSGSGLVPPLEPVSDAEFSTPAKPTGSTRPWGPWSTLGWTILWTVVMTAIPLFGFIAVVVVESVMNRDLGIARANLIAILTLLSAS